MPFYIPEIYESITSKMEVAFDLILDWVHTPQDYVALCIPSPFGGGQGPLALVRPKAAPVP